MSRREKIVWLIIGTAFLIAFVGLIPTHYEICETNPYTEKGSCTAYQVLPFLFLKVGKFLDASGVAVTAIFTAVLAASTIALWKATVRLALEAKTTADLQASDTRILQRAYLSVEPEGISASSDTSKCHPNIAIRNVGNLPARNIKWSIEYIVSLDDRLLARQVDKTKAEGENTLTPGTVMIQGGPIIYVGNDVPDLRNEVGLYLYVYGAVYYNDGFGNDRTTRYCHRYNAVNLDPVLREDRFADPIGVIKTIVGYRIDRSHARFHRYGNDAD